LIGGPAIYRTPLMRALLLARCVTLNSRIDHVTVVRLYAFSRGHSRDIWMACRASEGRVKAGLSPAALAVEEP
jgi:hypothetical protein